MPPFDPQPPATGYHCSVRLRSLPAHPSKPPQRRTVKTIQVLPTMITAGNLVVGVLAVSYLMDAASAPPARAESLLVRASWLLFIGMFLDTLDGRIARMTGTTADFGAQLDSLADVVTFGIAPAAMAKFLLTWTFPAMSSRLIFCFCLVYALGAALRLARYNVESGRMRDTGETPHVTRVFRGLPSPAAAGVMASLVLVRHELLQFGLDAQAAWIEWALLFVALGLLMVSRLPYAHLVNRYFHAGRAHPLIVLFLVLLLYLVIAHFVETVAGLFLLYALSGPLLMGTHRWFGWPAWVVDEGEDEEPLVPIDPLDADPDERVREQG